MCKRCRYTDWNQFLTHFFLILSENRYCGNEFEENLNLTKTVQIVTWSVKLINVKRGLSLWLNLYNLKYEIIFINCRNLKKLSKNSSVFTIYLPYQFRNVGNKCSYNTIYRR